MHTFRAPPLLPIWAASLCKIMIAYRQDVSERSQGPLPTAGGRSRGTKNWCSSRMRLSSSTRSFRHASSDHASRCTGSCAYAEAWYFPKLTL